MVHALCGALINIPCCIYTHIATWYEHFDSGATGSVSLLPGLLAMTALPCDGVSLKLCLLDQDGRRGYKG